MKRNYKISLLVIFLFILYVTPVVASTACDDPDFLVVDIKEAYYCDSDGDGDSDDIESIFSIYTADNGKMNFYFIFISLELPSGTVYEYTVFELARDEEITFKIYFIDHAYESGNYTLSITVAKYIGNGDFIIAGDSIIFDPPDGKEGVEPQMIIVIID